MSFSEISELNSSDTILFLNKHQCRNLKSSENNFDICCIDTCNEYGYNTSCNTIQSCQLTNDIMQYKLKLSKKKPTHANNHTFVQKNLPFRLRIYPLVFLICLIFFFGCEPFNVLPCFTFANAAASKDYYKILGLSKTAKLSEIKKAYRKLSLEFHPDRNPSPSATERFSEIATAYEVLNDPKKREIYDEYGEAGLQERVDNNYSDDPIFKFFHPFGFGGSGHHDRRKEKAETIAIHLYLTLDQLYFGELLQVNFYRPVICLRSEECIITKKTCSGPGIKTITQRLGPGFIVQNQIQDNTCVDREKGWKDKCSACPKGTTEMKMSATSLYIEAGMFDNEILTFESGGVQKLGCEPGDVTFRILSIPHSSFKRRGNNLDTTVYLTLLEALIGFTKTFTHISKKVLTLSKSSVTHEGEVQIISGWGMPLRGHSAREAQYGDLFITYRVQFPSVLDTESIILITKALSNVTSWKFQIPSDVEDSN